MFWFSYAGFLIGYGAQYVSNRFLVAAWAMYCVGLFLDVLNDILSKDTLSLLVAGTLLKKVGLILTCVLLYDIIHHERKTINKLNNEIKRRKILEEKLSFEANHDHLTQPGNRKSCFENFTSLSKKHPFLLYFDLDNFKTANDKYGHQTGDEVLILISNTLKCEFGNDNCFRLGGDEIMHRADSAMYSDKSHKIILQTPST